MDAKIQRSKVFAFTRENKRFNSRVQPINDEPDDDDDADDSNDDNNENDSKTTKEKTSSKTTAEQYPLSNITSKSNDALIRTSRNVSKQKAVLHGGVATKTPDTAKAGLLIAGGIILGVSMLIVLPTALGIYFTRNPAVINSTTSTSSTASVTAYWAFDNDGSDLYGVYNGVLVNGATFSNNTYVGYGFNLALNATANQSITISSPFLNLSYTSFTIEAWIYANSLTGDKSIFSQCQCSTCQDQCLYLIVRNRRMYMSFLLDDVIGATSLSTYTWYHVAYVYDYSIQTQMVYLQGVLDGSHTSSGPYQGQNGSISIGSSYLSTSTFDGYIDNLKLTTRAKSAAEILDDGSLVAHFSFEGTVLTQDTGPNQMNGSLSNAAAVSGKVGQGLAFSGSTSSYFQTYGYYQLGQSNQPFSICMWVYPYSISGGVLIQKTVYQSSSSGGWCYSLMGLTSAGQIVMLVYTTGIPSVIGPILTVRTWTHLGFTYSSTNGVRMYINGNYYGTSGTASWSTSGKIDWLSIGCYVSTYCGGSSISGVPYQGAIDEFYVYRRELNATEVYSLANP